MLSVRLETGIVVAASFKPSWATNKLTFRVAAWVETFLKAPTIIKWFMSKSIDDMVTQASAGRQTWSQPCSVFTEYNFEN